jgi:hypothetical protein
MPTYLQGIGMTAALHVGNRTVSDSQLSWVLASLKSHPMGQDHVHLLWKM